MSGSPKSGKARSNSVDERTYTAVITAGIAAGSALGPIGAIGGGAAMAAVCATHYALNGITDTGSDEQ